MIDHSHITGKILLYTTTRTDPSSLGVPGVPWHTQYLADQLTLFQPGGTNNDHHIANDTPKFSYLLPIPVSISQLLQTDIANNRTTPSPAITYLLTNVKGWEKLSQILCTKELLSYLR